MDLGRVGEREVPVLALLVRQLVRRDVDVAAVERDVARLERQHGVVRVDDRAAGHERQRRLGVVLALHEAALEHDVVGRLRAEDARAEPPDLVGEHLRRALDGAETRDGELARVGAGEAGVRVPVAVVAGPDVDVVGRDAEDVRDDLRRGRLVALALRRRPERDDDLAEDVELHGRDLVVARELQLRVQERRLAEVVRPGVERRADADAEQLPARLASSRRASIGRSR